MLIDLLPSKSSWVGHRHSYMLIMYNTLKVFLPHKYAIRDMFRINKMFDVPLKNTELIELMKSVDSHKEFNRSYSMHFDIDYYYWFKNKEIGQKLDATDAMLDLGVSFKNQGLIAKENNDIRFQRNVLICKFYLEGLKQMEVLERVRAQGIQCSIATVKRVLKDAGITYRNRFEMRFEDIDEAVLRPYVRAEKSASKKVSTFAKEEGERGRGVENQPAEEKYADADKAAVEKRKRANFGFQDVLIGDVLKRLKKGVDVYVMGVAGAGKTRLIKKWLKRFNNEQLERTFIVAPTGKAASNYENGLTIHSAFNMHLDIYEPDEPIKIKENLKTIDRLIIDEVGMVRYDILDYVLRIVYEIEKECNKRIQVVLLGDTEQLPPVVTDMDLVKLNNNWKRELGFEVQYGWFFLSKLFHQRNFEKYFLYKSLRNKDKKFNENLNKIRMGDKSGIRYFLRKVDRNMFYSEEYIHICTKRAIVSDVNSHIISEHMNYEDYQIFSAFYWDEGMKTAVTECDMQKVKAISNLVIYKNMPVMIVTNHEDYKNGMIGKVVSYDSDKQSIEVFLEDMEKVVTVKPQMYKLMVNGDIRNVYQFPIVPAYAITIHKSQGMTCEGAILHLEDCFTEGMLYTALSRVSDANKLYIADNIKPEMVRPNTFQMWDAYELLFGEPFSLQEIA